MLPSCSTRAYEPRPVLALFFGHVLAHTLDTPFKIGQKFPGWFRVESIQALFGNTPRMFNRPLLCFPE